MKKQIIISIILFVIAVGLTGCFGDNGDGDGGSTDSRFVGEWQAEEGGFSFIFNSNGTVYGKYSGISEYMGNWIVKGNEICVSAPGEATQCSRFEFSNDDNTVKVYFDEDGMVFNKKIE
jgi:hypothetical protein